MSRKGKNIYKRKDKRWEARHVKGYHADGSVRYGYCYGKSFREAKQKVTEAKAALLHNRQMPPSKRNRRFSHCCDEWLRINRNHIKESTYAKYSVMLENHVKPRLGGCLAQAPCPL